MKALVVHSGGMDSSICLALAIREWGRERVVSFGVDYGQRHRQELTQSARICSDWGVKRVEFQIQMGRLTRDALTDHSLLIEDSQVPSTLVVGRNGLFTRLAAIQAHQLGASCIYLGVMGQEHSGYRDCSSEYMALKQQILRIDLANPQFEIRTPLMAFTKAETLELAHQLGILDYLLRTTITCYEGIACEGCRQCPACMLRNRGLRTFAQAHPEVALPYSP
jgi:7-cyano-7-deazaguanine synthase